jgi:DNA-binding FadR family transcriptional regulator
MIWAIDPTEPASLRDQIVTCVRRGITNRELAIGAQLPPAARMNAHLTTI